MARLKTPANLKKWHTSYICYVKEHGGEREINDDAAHYIFGFAIAPEANQLGQEYEILTTAIKKENGQVLEQYFGTPGLEEITIKKDNLVNGLSDINRFYAGEKWGLVYDFLIETYEGGKIGYINADYGNYFYFLPEYPLLLVDALSMFNALSFENTTHVIRLHQMWNRLRDIRNIAFTFKDAPKPQDFDTGYTKLFIPIEKVVLKSTTKNNADALIKLINTFQLDYKIKKENYFKEIAELKREAKWIAFDYKNAFEAYLGRILHSYIYFLQVRSILKACVYCGHVFPYSKNKLFCSEKDGNNCGQTVRNKRFYKKYRDKLRPKARQETKKLREFYAVKNVKK